METPNLGGPAHSSITISVRSVASDSALISIHRGAFSYRWQRWLVLPCRYEGTAAPAGRAGHATLSELLSDVEAFWSDTARGHHYFTAGSVITPYGDTKPPFEGGRARDAWIALPYDAATDRARPAQERVRQAVHAALRLRNPTNTKIRAPLYLDWRSFTGIIVLRSAPDIGDGYLGELELPTGNTLADPIDCPVETRVGDAAGERMFQVIELASSQLTQAGVAVAVGESLGLERPPDDPFTLMSARADARRYVDPRVGPSGPAVDTSALRQLGWLEDSEIHRMSPPAGATTSGGRVHLVAVSNRGNGAVCAEGGPYRFECRVPTGADVGLPGPLVLARETANGAAPRVLRAGDQLSWSSGALGLADSGHARVVSLTTDGAVLDYASGVSGPVQAGGGRLYGGATVLVGPDGTILPIPPGDPLERQATQAIDQLQRVADAIEQRTDGSPA